MRIRDLQWDGLSMWPPEWGFSDEGAGEDGFLKNVRFHNDQTPQCISVIASHLGNERNGIIILENPAHLEILCQKLKENIGRPLSQVGDLEIDFWPLIAKKGLKQVRPQITYNARSETFPPVAMNLKKPN
jgi:hypothetical protein